MGVNGTSGSIPYGLIKCITLSVPTNYGQICAGGTEAVMHSIQRHVINPIISSTITTIVQVIATVPFIPGHEATGTVVLAGPDSAVKVPLVMVRVVMGRFLRQTLTSKIITW